MNKTFLGILCWKMTFVVWSAFFNSGLYSEGTDSSKYFYVETYVVADAALTRRYNFDHKSVKRHIDEMMVKANEVLQQLRPPGFIDLIGIQCYQSATCRCRVEWKDTRRTWSCRIPRSVQRYEGDVAVGRRLGADHDGEGSARSCPPIGYLMSTSSSHTKKISYSNCSIEDIAYFLKSEKASCLFNNTNTPLPGLPLPTTTNDPAFDQRRVQMCERHLPVSDKLVGTESYGQCSFRCIILGRAYLLQYEEDGRPCNKTNPSQQCYRGKCLHDTD
ncbi:hypothetical protein MTO96_007856 [Rhipicephalus appendiculatus]